MNPENLTLGLAFIAGLISFVSPCVLPLVPAYIGYMGGRMTNTVASRIAVGTGGQAALGTTAGARFTTALHGVAFVAGFTLVFVVVGLISTAFLQQMTDAISRIGGLLIIFFGLHFMGVIRALFNYLLGSERLLSNPLLSPIMALAGTALILWGFTGTLVPSINRTIPTMTGEQTIIQWQAIAALIVVAAYLLWLVLGGAFTRPAAFWKRLIQGIQTALYADTRRQMVAGDQQGYLGSAIMGVVFSAGWTPCIGPVYGAVLTLAANTGDVVRAAPLLAAYSLGLGVPFVLTALLLDSAQGVLRRLQRHMHKIELVSGAFLILIGVLVATGTLQNLSQSLQVGELAEAAIEFEEQVIGSLTGQTETVEPTPAPPAAEAGAQIGGITDAAAAASAPISGTDVGNVAPDFQTVADSGDPLRLSDYRGQIVVLNFWFTGCAPCRIEMPEFEAAYQENADRGLVILAVNREESPEQVSAFAQELGLSFPMVMDEQGEIQELYGIFSYPSTFIIDRDGVIVNRQFGALTADKIQTLVEQALA